MMSATSLQPETISVIVCTHTLERLANLRAAVASVLAQTPAPLEAIVVIDGDEALEQGVRAGLHGARIMRSRHGRGLSGARQTGAEAARGSILAFLDDDAIAQEHWLERLVEAYRDPNVLGVGGSIEPAWEQGAPRWFPPEFNWVVGCTYAGMPTSTERVRNVIGANMSMRAAVLARAGAFDARLGRAAGSRTLSGSAEETELCIRATRAHPGHYWIYEPRARVVHAVPPQRRTWRYFVRRCAVEGTAKAVLAGIAGGDEGLRSERAYVRSVLPRALRRELRAAARGSSDALARAAAITAGLAITAAAYARSRGFAAGRDSAAGEGAATTPVAPGSPQDEDHSPRRAPLASERPTP
jgi:glucosyl-dolichyl phosphate glucuronosyltransferase